MAFWGAPRLMDLCCLLAAAIFFLADVSESATAHRAARQTLFFNIGTTPDPNQCTTPDNVEGECKGLVLCTELYTVLRTNPTPDFINFLRKSICRYEKSTPVICCPKSQEVVSEEPEPIPETTTPSTTSTSSTTPSTTTSSTTTSTTTTTTTSTTTTTPPPVLKGAALLPEACGEAKDVFTRIVGGTPARIGQYPSIAALGFEDSSGEVEFLCGGALITNQHIITAAHCVRNRDDLKVIRLGEHDLSIETDGVHEDFGIQERILHERFNTISFANDIAILKLDRKVEFKKRIEPICLPLPGRARLSLEELLEDKAAGIVAGWGSVSYNNVSSPILLHVNLPILTEEDCRTKYEVFKQVVIDESTMCAGRGGRDACQGDSGGPMMYSTGDHSYIIGIVSFGFRCAEPKFPGVYTRVTHYTDWILNNLE